MLSGSIWDKMILFALPLAFTGVLQQLYNAADVAVLGHFVSDEAMAAVGNNVPIIGLIVSLCMGLALGANVVVAQALGMRDEERASRGVHTAFYVAVVFGVVMAIAGEIGADWIIACLEVPESVQADSELYLRVYLLGMPFIAVYNFFGRCLSQSRGYPNAALGTLLCHDFQYRRQSLFCVGLRHGHWGRGLCHRSRQCACRGDSFLARMPHDGTAQT